MLSSARQDIWNMAALWEVQGLRRWARTLTKIAFYPRVKAVLWFRISQLLWRWHLRPVALLVQARVLRTAGAEIHPAAQIGPGLALIHSVGVVIGHDVKAGEDLRLYQNVTLGHGGNEQGQPVIGDRVVVGAGAKILGHVFIGHDVIVGANAVVISHVPDAHVVVGVPGRARRRSDLD